MKSKIDDSLFDSYEETANDISDVSWLDIPVLIIFIVLFIIVALQFFTRYVLNDSLGWTEEIARYFLILLGFVGSIHCVRHNKHIQLEFAKKYFSKQINRFLAPFSQIIVCVFWTYCGWFAVELSQRTGSFMVSIRLPKSIIYYIVSASCFFMAIFTLIKIYQSFTQGNFANQKKPGRN